VLIARFRAADGAPRFGVVEGDSIVPLQEDYPDGQRLGVAALLAAAELPGRAGDRLALDEVSLLAPVPSPGKVICIGANYAAHAEESGVEPPAHPEVFAKFPNTIADPGAPIVVGAEDEAVDWEGELAAIVGRTVRGELDDQGALAAIGGYTVANDVSARTWQLRVSQWSAGKSFDGYCPLGPWVATADAIADPQDLRVRTWIDDELVQDGATEDMIFGVATIVRYLARVMTLEPGDVILTGTPDGVGFVRTPPRYLRPGDTVRVEVDGIGTLANPVVAA
jgi:2-keto-4-pentenoate hydratase/2-oxohepta-3-ene-1,7-dioic acid hydratase in catechol pathway